MALHVSSDDVLFIVSDMATQTKKSNLEWQSRGKKVMYSEAQLEATTAQVTALIKEAKRIGGISVAISQLKKMQNVFQPSLFDGQKTDF